MEDYSTNSFVLSFIRFSCKVGFPKKLLPDAGSQLIKGCEDMSFSYTDLKNKLHKEYGVVCEPHKEYGVACEQLKEYGFACESCKAAKRH